MTIATDIPTSIDQNLIERASDQSYQMAQAAAIAADDRKGENIVLLAIGEVSTLAEYFVIASGLSKHKYARSLDLLKMRSRKSLDVSPETLRVSKMAHGFYWITVI